MKHLQVLNTKGVLMPLLPMMKGGKGKRTPPPFFLEVSPDLPHSRRGSGTAVTIGRGGHIGCLRCLIEGGNHQIRHTIYYLVEKG